MIFRLRQTQWKYAHSLAVTNSSPLCIAVVSLFSRISCRTQEFRATLRENYLKREGKREQGLTNKEEDALKVEKIVCRRRKRKIVISETPPQMRLLTIFLPFLFTTFLLTSQKKLYILLSPYIFYIYIYLLHLYISIYIYI